MERILRLKKRNLAAAKHRGAPAKMILAQVSNEIRSRDLDERISAGT